MSFYLTCDFDPLALLTLAMMTLSSSSAASVANTFTCAGCMYNRVKDNTPGRGWGTWVSHPVGVGTGVTVFFASVILEGLKTNPFHITCPKLGDHSEHIQKRLLGRKISFP